MIKIPTPIMPSDEELMNFTKRQLQIHEGLRMDKWSDGLKMLSTPFLVIEIPKELFYSIVDYEKRDSNKIREELDKIVGSYFVGDYEKSFFKLITRSGKDLGVLPVTNAEDILDQMWSSMRLFDDMCYLHRDADACKLIIRPFVDYNINNEWRVFIKNREVVGITQYDIYNSYKGDINEMLHRLTELIALTLNNTDLDIFVADYYIETDATKSMKSHLIELNPFGLSDPCLLDYNNMNCQIATHLYR